MICPKCNQKMKLYDWQPEWYDCFDPKIGHFTKETGRMHQIWECNTCNIQESTYVEYDPNRYD